MGCHTCHNASRLLYQCFSKLCWCCCQDGGLEKISQVCGLASVIFQPIALETLGPMDFFTDLGHKIGVFKFLFFLTLGIFTTEGTKKKKINSRFQPMQVSNANIRRALRSFPHSLPGGPDGFMPQYILDLLTGATDVNRRNIRYMQMDKGPFLDRSSSKWRVTL